jgi:hypothetical protein
MVYNNNKSTIVQLKPQKLHKFYLPKLKIPSSLWLLALRKKKQNNS